MELSVFTSSAPRPLRVRSHCPCSPNPALLLLGRLSFRRFRLVGAAASEHRFRVFASSVRNSAPPGGCGEAERAASSSDFWRDSELVEVIGIGSRKEAVLNFCLDSPFRSPSLRYWNIVSKDSTKIQLQQKVVGTDSNPNPNLFEVPTSFASSSKTIILVASAGYGTDHISAANILRTIRSANGYTVAIILKPFSFEGKKRQDEIKDLKRELQEHTNLLIDLDTDKLLKKDLVTLDEAVKTANNAVLLAITAVSALKSDMHQKIIGASRNEVRNIEVSEVFRTLERFKEAKIGFGAGYNIKTSILQSIYDCPFLSVGVKDFDGMIVCVIASSDAITEADIDAFVKIFHQSTEYTKEILLSTIHEPSLEPNLLVTTVVALGTNFTGQLVSQKTGILTRLAQRFPFILRLLRRDDLQSSEIQRNNVLETSYVSEEIDVPEKSESSSAVNIIAEGSVMYSEKNKTINSDDNVEFHASSSESERSADGFFEDVLESSAFQDPITEGTAFQREELVGWNSGLGYQIAQQWAKEKAAEVGPTLKLDKLSIFSLPVGVRPSEESKDRFNMSPPTQYPTPKTKNSVKSKSSVYSTAASLNELTDTGLEAVKDFYNTASGLLKGNSVDPPKKQGLLSARAASMLEAERDSPKSWSPIVELKYQGGVYKGRCQGGLPEGKGRLVLGDGSIYDGMWRYGKRSGSGSLYFSNGDVFQGSWRDDVMHGKGWFYFHTGDRWFASFWKGKANGEGRFYSKSGDVLFGSFHNGWRHGEFVCIDVHGRRRIENWDHGILVNSRPLDS